MLHVSGKHFFKNKKKTFPDFSDLCLEMEAWARLWLKPYIYLLQWDCGEVVRVDEGQIFSVWSQSSARFCGLNLILQADNGVNSTMYCKTVEETFIVLIDDSCQHSSGLFYHNVFAVT